MAEPPTFNRPTRVRSSQGSPRFRSVAQPGSARAWGARGRRFESCRSDQFARPRSRSECDRSQTVRRLAVNQLLGGSTPLGHPNMRPWRNGRRARLRAEWFTPCEFDSRRPHQFLAAARLDVHRPPKLRVRAPPARPICSCSSTDEQAHPRRWVVGSNPARSSTGT